MASKYRQANWLWELRIIASDQDRRRLSYMNVGYRGHSWVTCVGLVSVMLIEDDAEPLLLAAVFRDSG